MREIFTFVRKYYQGLTRTTLPEDKLKTTGEKFRPVIPELAKYALTFGGGICT